MTVPEYFQNVRKHSYNFIFAGVLLIFYEVGMLVLPNPLKIANGIDVFFEAIWKLIPGGSLIISGILIVLGLFFLIKDLRSGVIIRPFHFVLMTLESFFWAALIFFNLSYVVGLLVGNSWVAMQVTKMENPPTYYIQDVVLSFGAGFYEELFFRLILIQIFILIAKAFQKDPTRWNIRLVIIIVGALLFSMVHYIGTYGDSFNFNSFLQRFIFGLIMYPLFMYRGFGIAAWSHALYDVMVFTMRRID